MITQARLKELFNYNPSTGIFTRRIAVGYRGCYPAGQIVGTDTGDGYLRIGADFGEYKSHRLAFLYMTGTMPDEVDHIDRNRANNRWDNLRAVTSQINKHNLGIRSDNTSGYIGVCWDKSVSKWKAYINLNGRMHNLGHASNLEDAVALRKNAEPKFHPSKPPC